MSMRVESGKIALQQLKYIADLNSLTMLKQPPYPF